MNKRSQHVVPNPNGGWSVRRYGAERASGVFKTQADAIKRGTELAKREGAELYVHRADGTIREKNSYGNDPHPPKG
ncbi:MAG: DUF2188 domain-containing protein [Candidatus Devosia phytovorans]|uniref:DUF2188 domain-containing protein n=1 Tax=Candidatus Devosia phytovorans TaxID=3121372 RepID=A0AAJ6B0E4_9HYPH|nr:DUF2188 domain-containing protein [Devosia sp.]WEK05615.1 MAG: DUF2188 domain-containing protein [Devosia sp.]